MSGSAYQERLEARKADFKKGIDVDEARRRRDDDQLSIRKSKREDKLGTATRAECLFVLICVSFFFNSQAPPASA